MKKPKEIKGWGGLGWSHFIWKFQDVIFELRAVKKQIITRHGGRGISGKLRSKYLEAMARFTNSIRGI